MFVGMALCLPATAVIRRLQSLIRRLDAAAEGESLHMAPPLRQPLLERASPGSTSSFASSVTGGPPFALVAPAAGGATRQTLLLILIPTLFDLAATVLMSIGLLSITASVWLMLRGSEVVFTALLSVTWLRRSLSLWHWSGIAVCVVSYWGGWGVGGGRWGGARLPPPWVGACLLPS